MENRGSRRSNIVGIFHTTSFFIYLLCSLFLLIAAVHAPGKIEPLDQFMLLSVFHIFLHKWFS